MAHDDVDERQGEDRKRDDHDGRHPYRQRRGTRDGNVRDDDEDRQQSRRGSRDDDARPPPFIRSRRGKRPPHTGAEPDEQHPEEQHEVGRLHRPDLEDGRHPLGGRHGDTGHELHRNRQAGDEHDGDEQNMLQPRQPAVNRAWRREYREEPHEGIAEQARQAGVHDSRQFPYASREGPGVHPEQRREAEEQEARQEGVPVVRPKEPDEQGGGHRQQRQEYR